MFIFLCRLIVLFTLKRLFICLDNIVFVFPHVCLNIYYFDWTWILSILFHISNLMVSTKAFCSWKLLCRKDTTTKKKRKIQYWPERFATIELYSELLIERERKNIAFEQCRFIQRKIYESFVLCYCQYDFHFVCAVNHKKWNYIVKQEELRRVQTNKKHFSTGKRNTFHWKHPLCI